MWPKDQCPNVFGKHLIHHFNFRFPFISFCRCLNRSVFGLWYPWKMSFHHQFHWPRNKLNCHRSMSSFASLNEPVIDRCAYWRTPLCVYHCQNEKWIQKPNATHNNAVKNGNEIERASFRIKLELWKLNTLLFIYSNNHKFYRTNNFSFNLTKIMLHSVCCLFVDEFTKGVQMAQKYLCHCALPAINAHRQYRRRHRLHRSHIFWRDALASFVQCFSHSFISLVGIRTKASIYAFSHLHLRKRGMNANAAKSTTVVNVWMREKVTKWIDVTQPLDILSVAVISLDLENVC